MKKQIEDCPGERIALIGYSEGAHVVGDALIGLNQITRDHIGQVLLFGDPRFNPATTAIDRGDYDPKLGGIIDARTVASLWYPKMRSYCSARDFV